MAANMKPTKSGVVTFAYGRKYRTGGIHKGLDFSAPVGTPVYACVAGTVVHAGRHVYKKGWGYSFGLHVIIDNVRFVDKSAGLWASYCHLSKVNVKVGQKVKRGDVLGLSGNTGRSTGAHLHLEIQSGRTWSPHRHVNPAKWVKA